MNKKALIFIAIIVLLVLWIFVPWLAFSIGLVVLGSLGYVERIINIQWSRDWNIFLIVLFVILSAGNVIYSHNEERNLRKELEQVEDAASTAEDLIADFAEYGEVATYDFNGYQKSGQFLSPFTPVAKWNEGHLTVRNNVYNFDCSKDSMKHYESTIKKCPKFPFAYLALSMCLLNKKDSSWKEPLVNARLILQKTTKIPLHSQTHDSWLTQVNKLLDPVQMNSVLSTLKKYESGHEEPDMPLEKDTL